MKVANLFKSRGLAFLKKGIYDKAILDFDQSLRYIPDSFTFTWRGVAWGALGKYDKAIADQNEAIRRHPKNASAYFNRGIIHENRGLFELALADFRILIQINPKDKEGIEAFKRVQSKMEAAIK